MGDPDRTVFDVQTAVMTPLPVPSCPHASATLTASKRIYGYLSKMRHAIIRIRTSEPGLLRHPREKSTAGRAPATRMQRKPSHTMHQRLRGKTHPGNRLLRRQSLPRSSSVVDPSTGILHMLNKDSH